MDMNPKNFDILEDPINAPKHYQFGEIECIDALRAQATPEEYRGYLKLTIGKYIWRERYKGGLQSLMKARWFLEKLIEHDSATEDTKIPGHEPWYKETVAESQSRATFDPRAWDSLGGDKAGPPAERNPALRGDTASSMAARSHPEGGDKSGDTVPFPIPVHDFSAGETRGNSRG